VGHLIQASKVESRPTIQPIVNNGREDSLSNAKTELDNYVIKINLKIYDRINDKLSKYLVRPNIIKDKVTTATHVVRTKKSSYALIRQPSLTNCFKREEEAYPLCHSLDFQWDLGLDDFTKISLSLVEIPFLAKVMTPSSWNVPSQMLQKQL